MIYAEITKAVVVQDDKGQTVLMAVAQYDREYLNMKISYDFDTLDRAAFFRDIKEQIAKDFDIAVQRVQINERKIMDRMERYNMLKNGVLVNPVEKPRILH